MDVSLRTLQQQEWADKMLDSLTAISETIATKRQKSMTAVKQVDSLHDDLDTLQETTRIAMEARLNSHRKIEAALSNGKACSQPDPLPFISKSNAIEELQGKTGKGFDTQTSMQVDSTSLECVLPSVSMCNCRPVVPSANSPNISKSRNVVDGINDACHHQVPSQDLRW